MDADRTCEEDGGLARLKRRHFFWAAARRTSTARPRFTSQTMIKPHTITWWRTRGGWCGVEWRGELDTTIKHFGGGNALLNMAKFKKAAFTQLLCCITVFVYPSRVHQPHHAQAIVISLVHQPRPPPASAPPYWIDQRRRIRAPDRPPPFWWVAATRS